MPARVYYGFLGRFAAVSREYAVLKNSHVQPTALGDRIETLCDVRDTELLLDRANQFFPEAAPYIEQALASVQGHPPIGSMKRGFRCGNCGHATTSTNGVEAPRGTPIDRISVQVDPNRIATWQCGECHCYNKIVPSQRAVNAILNSYRTA